MQLSEIYGNYLTSTLQAVVFVSASTLDMWKSLVLQM